MTQLYQVKAVIFLIFWAAAVTAQAGLIQHTDQIAEVRFTGTTYELGRHVGEVAKKQITDAIARFDKTLGIMLPGLSVESLTSSFDRNGIYAKLQKASPDAAAYIKGLSESLQLPPNYLLAVGMSDEAILESQSKGGIGFLEEAPAKCTVMAQTDGTGNAWGAANFDYMGVNYTGLIVLNHTDNDGKTRVIQTWAGLIPYGGITVGGQPLLMNTMADEGTARQIAGGEILAEGSVPSYHLSWDAYNADGAEELKNVFRHRNYTAFFSYVMLDANDRITSIENSYSGELRTKQGYGIAHANHSIYTQYDFVDPEFGAKSLARQEAAEEFLKAAQIDTTEQQALKRLQTKPLWKGRGELMGTVTSTYFSVDGRKVDMAIYTALGSEPVRIRNY